VADIADNLRFHHVLSRKAKLRLTDVIENYAQLVERKDAKTGKVRRIAGASGVRMSFQR
jgi:hypothetical protein